MALTPGLPVDQPETILGRLGATPEEGGEAPMFYRGVPMTRQRTRWPTMQQALSPR